jgi:hypothetical protein
VGTSRPPVAHHRQWAERMKEIGLHPSTSGEPGGKETGRTSRGT